MVNSAVTAECYSSKEMSIRMPKWHWNDNSTSGV
jgi:hypothetical protein